MSPNAFTVFPNIIPGNLTVQGNLNVVGSAAVGSGLPNIVAAVDLAAQAANVAFPTLLYAIPAGAGGKYRISYYITLTQPATTSSTLPSVLLGFTELDNNVVTSIGGGMSNTSGVNTTQTNSAIQLLNTANNAIISAKGGTNINYGTNGYLTSGATAMQYALHLKVEYLGA